MSHRTVKHASRLRWPVAVVCAALAGCAGGSGGTGDVARDAGRRTGQPGQGPSVRIAALVDGAPVTWDELSAFAVEASGGQALEELALDRAVAREAERRALKIGPEAIDRERALMIESISAGAAVDADDGERLLAEVRRVRGLGPKRFEALLRRSATLRALVQGEALLDEAGIERAHAMLHGERRRARIITVDTAREAADACARLSRGESFGEVAARVSTDASAPRGGLIEPISAVDPAYPQSVRTALARLAPGEVSGPISLERGFAVLKLEEVLPGSGRSLEETRGEVERAARLREERVRMDGLAQRLLGSAGVTPLDAGLRQSWTWRRPSAP